MANASRLITTAMRFRARLIVADKLAAQELLTAYGPTHAAIKTQLLAIQSKIEDAQKAGKPLGKSWLFQEGRAKALQAQIEREMSKFAPKAADIVRKNQAARVVSGRDDSLKMAKLSAGRAAPSVVTSWSVLPHSAIEDLVGFSADGSPLRDLFDKLGPEVGASVRSQLGTGLALGRNPRVVARAVNQVSGMGLSRALTISRTETQRAYRETARRSYDASPVVQGWTWLSARDDETCAACWGVDGQHFDTEDGMDAHPNCRCTMVPETSSTPDIGTGPDLFDALPASSQQAVLGPSKFAAYSSGKIGISDLVTKRENADWGASYQEGSLKGALAR